jgi:hypothetical protein
MRLPAHESSEVNSGDTPPRSTVSNHISGRPSQVLPKGLGTRNPLSFGAGLSRGGDSVFHIVRLVFQNVLRYPSCGVARRLRPGKYALQEVSTVFVAILTAQREVEAAQGCTGLTICTTCLEINCACLQAQCRCLCMSAHKSLHFLSTALFFSSAMLSRDSLLQPHLNHTHVIRFAPARIASRKARRCACLYKL